MYQHNLTVQRALPAKVVGSVAYVGSSGRHLIERYDANTPIPTRLSDGTLFTPATAPRRDPLFGELQSGRLSGMSYYSSLQVSAVCRLAEGLQAQASYTFAKSIDTGGGLFSEEASNAAVGVEIPDNIFNERGLSNFDIRHSVVLNLLYEIPAGKNLRGVSGQVFRGWGISTIRTFPNGLPFTVENSANRSQNKL